MSSEMYVVGGIVLVVLVLWRVTRKIKIRDRAKNNRSAAMSRENIELRHVVTEMAMEKHHSHDEGRGKHPH